MNNAVAIVSCLVAAVGMPRIVATYELGSRCRCYLPRWHHSSNEHYRRLLCGETAGGRKDGRKTTCHIIFPCRNMPALNRRFLRLCYSGWFYTPRLAVLMLERSSFLPVEFADSTIHEQWFLLFKRYNIPGITMVVAKHYRGEDG